MTCGGSLCCPWDNAPGSRGRATCHELALEGKMVDSGQATALAPSRTATQSRDDHSGGPVALELAAGLSVTSSVICEA
jgi:hypothetical protein